MTWRAPERAVIAVNDKPMLPCPNMRTRLPRMVSICWQE